MILIQVYFNSGCIYLLNRAAISLFGFYSGGALATLVGVLIEVPVMLSIVKIVNTTRGWHCQSAADSSPGSACNFSPPYCVRGCGANACILKRFLALFLIDWWRAAACCSRADAGSLAGADGHDVRGPPVAEQSRHVRRRPRRRAAAQRRQPAQP